MFGMMGYKLGHGCYNEPRGKIIENDVSTIASISQIMLECQYDIPHILSLSRRQEYG